MRLLAVLAALVLAPAGGALPALDDDAGSGRDAPDAPAGGVPIQPGVVYEASFRPPLDAADHYSFHAAAGDLLEATVWPTSGCFHYYAPSGARVWAQCVTTLPPPVVRTTANETGTWHLGVTQPFASTAPRYRFSLGVTSVAPDPTPPGTPSFQVGKYIQPGEMVTTAAGSCTLNFAYDGTGAKAGTVLVGTAAHCFRGGVGEPASVPGLGRIGHVVYMGDYNGLNTGRYENGIPGAQVDFALIEVDAALAYRVKGEVKGHPGLPTALKPHTAVRLGDRFDFSGYGAGAHVTPVTREERSGVYTVGGPTGWNAVAPISPGDSGGPVLHADGRAVGVATHLSAGGAGGPWLDVALQQAAAAGWTVALRPAY